MSEAKAMAAPAVPDRPILFSAPMVRAILAGRKSRTRRLVKPAVPAHLYLQPGWGHSPGPNPVAFGRVGLWRVAGPDYPDASPEDDRWCPYGLPGDRLWVREAWGYWPADPDGGRVLYRATCPDNPEGWPARRGPIGEFVRWRPSIHLARKRSRIALEVTTLGAERLQSITEAEAEAEGVERREVVVDAYPPRRAGFEAKGLDTYREAYRRTWDEIHGAGSWASDPYVWVIGFRVLWSSP